MDAKEQVMSERGTCRVCHQFINYYDPTGDGLAAFWSHVVHPSDEHDAEPEEG